MRVQQQLRLRLLRLLGLHALTACAEGGRSTHSFDGGWLFHYGDAAKQELCPSSAFQGFNDMYCPTWGHQAAYDITEDECKRYCCGDSSCAGWNYNGRWCALGNSHAGCVPGQGPGSWKGKGNWTGGIRAVPAPLIEPPSGGPHDVTYNDSTWRALDLPHDYVVEQAPVNQPEWNHGFRPKEVAWYRKHFHLDAAFSNKNVTLVFEGVFRSSDFWLNGKHLGHHSSGYTQARFALGPDSGALFGSEKNVLAVRIDPRANEGWWYEGGGIYRHTKVIVTGPVAIAPYSVYVPSEVTGTITRGATGAPPTADATVTIQANVTGTTTALSECEDDLSFSFEIFDPTATSVWKGTATITSGHTATTAASLKNASLWEQPADKSPTAALYTLVSTLYGKDNSVLDVVNTTFGVRKLTFDPDKGFLLNDQHIKVKGMCNHQDFAGVGTAVPNRVEDFRVAKLQSFGVNAWRMSHNPPNPELLNAADRRGLLVWDENRQFGDFESWYNDMSDLIKRDRNHPSVVWWSICNEQGCILSEDNVTLEVGKRFRAIVKNLDRSRPISGAWSNGQGYKDRALGHQWAEQVTDVFGLNYDVGSTYDSFHQQFPKIPFISSESCSCTSDRDYQVNDTEALIGAQASWSCIKDCWQPIATREFVEGSFDWTGFDYRGEETPTKWPSTNSHFGVVDLAGYMKADAYYYQAQFTDIPTVRIVPNEWEYANTAAAKGAATTPKPVWVYTNAHSAELFQDGKSLGKQTIAQFDKGGWNVTWKPGNLTVVAFDADGKPYATDSVVTPGAPTRLRLSVDWPAAPGGAILADGQDCAMLTAMVLDSAGHIVHESPTAVKFEVTGGILLGAGNGDPSDHTPEGRPPEGSDTRSAWDGLVRAIVQSSTTAGELMVTASAAGLQSATAKIKTTEFTPRFKPI